MFLLMKRTSENWKYAYISALTLIFFSTLVSYIVRAVKLSFEWFEIYQTLIIGAVFFTLMFLAIGFGSAQSPLGISCAPLQEDC